MRRSAALLLLVALAPAACERERRDLAIDPPQAAPAGSGSPDSASPLRLGGAPWAYAGNAYELNQGKLLYARMNCTGCHARGGGAIGPALMDSAWRYGSEPESIFTTLVRGRPNGMPAFAGRLPDHQVWQLVAYVRSMSGLAPFTAAPGRSDEMHSGQPENSRGEATP